MGAGSDGTDRKTVAARRGQKAAMKVRVCPKCQRGNALSRALCDANPRPGEVTVYCRFCDYVRLRP